MHVVICIVGFRNAADIAACLRALAAQTHANFEVLLCENGGAAAADKLRAALPLLAARQAVRIIVSEENLGYAGGVNVCMRAAPGADAWWILNPDTAPDRDALHRLVERLERGDCEAVGSTIYYANNRVECRGGLWRSWLARAVGLDYGKPVDAPPSADLEERLWYLSGASMLVGRNFVDAVGLMREDYFLYGEEVEWCLRGRRAGLRLGIAPKSLVLHKQGTTTGSVPDMRRRSRTAVYLDERNKLLLTRDCYPSRIPVVALGALAMLALRFGKRAAWRQLGYALSGWAAGLRNQRGAPAWIEGAATDG